MWALATKSLTNTSLSNGVDEKPLHSVRWALGWWSDRRTVESWSPWLNTDHRVKRKINKKQMSLWESEGCCDGRRRERKRREASPEGPPRPHLISSTCLLWPLPRSTTNYFFSWLLYGSTSTKYRVVGMEGAPGPPSRRSPWPDQRCVSPSWRRWRAEQNSSEICPSSRRGAAGWATSSHIISSAEFQHKALHKLYSSCSKCQRYQNLSLVSLTIKLSRRIRIYSIFGFCRLVQSKTSRTLKKDASRRTAILNK